ncbi:Phospholipase A1-Igamma1 [Spatholobus suberectus]|nr:Phospholipase A1-Igamma1 [Spatholobus suberectus]
MASSLSNMLIIPFSKTYEPSFRSTHPKFLTAPPPLARTQTPIRLAARDNSSTSILREQEQEQEHEEATTHHRERNNYNYNYNYNYKPKLEEQLARLPEAWREIQGESDWAGLLEPMDPLLRMEVIRYGELAQACYDAFDFDPFSKYCGSCRFTRRDFFSSLDMSHHGYTVTRYLYATANINLPNFFKHSRWSKMWSKHANWAGYVAVSDDATSHRLGRRDIAIAWRGTVTRLEWVADLMDFLKPISSNGVPCPDQTVKVESGFLELYTDKEESCGYCKYSAREQVLSEVKRLLEMHGDEEVSITITGHSLGSALAILSAYDIAETGANVVGAR